jgi:signal transduction histidine kinase
MTPSQADDSKDQPIAPSRWVHIAMYLLVFVSGFISITQLVIIHNAEKLKKSDVELLSLAASQSTLSQKVIRFAMAFQRDQAEEELRSSVQELQTQGAQLEFLVRPDLSNSAKVVDDRYSGIEKEFQQWKKWHALLIQEGAAMVQTLEVGDMKESGVLSSSVQITAANNLAASNNLYRVIDRIVNGRSGEFINQINQAILTSLALTLIFSPFIIQYCMRLLKRQYKQLVQQSIKLEQSVHEREKIAQAAYVEAEAATRTALEEKMMFIAIGSHDLRTPLQTIVSLSDLILIKYRGEQENELGVNLSRLRIACRQVEEIAIDLGEFVRDSEGYSKERKRKVRVGQIVLDACDMYYELAEEKKLELILKEKHHIDEIHIEENSLRRTLSNLISNAIKYTNTGSVTIETGNPDSRTLAIAVTDTGIGISEEHWTQVTKPFFRATEARSSDKNGLGLGLAIVDRFVKFMGGEMSVTSKKGVGSTFAIRVPFESPSFEKSTFSPSLSVENWTIDFGVSIVFVDDEKPLADEFSHVARALGKDVVAQGFIETTEALKYISENDVDFVFSDLQMHPIDGYEFARQIKALGLAKPPILIAMSAYMLKKDTENIFDRFLEKPFALHQIASVIKDFRVKTDVLPAKV